MLVVVCPHFYSHSNHYNKVKTLLQKRITMKVSPNDENGNHQGTGRGYKEPVQSAMLQSSSLPLTTGASPTRTPNNVRNEISDSSSHKDEQTLKVGTSYENEDAGFSDFIANVGAEENTKNNQWQCSTCSYINKNPLRLTCDICGTARVGHESEDEIIKKQLEEKRGMCIETCQDEEDYAPIPAAQIAARYESLEETAKKPDIIEEDDESPPFLPWQIGCEDEDLSTKKSYLTTSNHPSISECQPSAPPAIDVVVPPSTSDIERNMSNSTQPAVEIIIHRPPPPSMLPRHSDDDEEEPSDDLPSLPQIEATAVEDVVYDAIAVPSSDANQEDKGDQESTSWWKRSQKYMFVWLMALVIGAIAATIATLVGTKDDANTVVPVETLQSTVSINDTQYTMSPSNTTTSTTKPSTAVS